MRKLYMILIPLLLLTACKANPKVEKRMEIPADSRQLLRVTTTNWNDRFGTMERFEKDGIHWKKVGRPIPVILGRNGLGWGLGLHQIPKGANYVKREGDGRSPAGLFYLGHGFGYEPLQIKFPYKVYTRDYHCVDDSNSKWYNKIVNSKRVERDYKSFEYMKLKNNLYKYGITVKHNPEQIKNGGSCIFLHIRGKNSRGTAGCTAMNQDDIIQVLKWLKPEDKPLLLQLPMIEMSRVKLP